MKKSATDNNEAARCCARVLCYLAAAVLITGCHAAHGPADTETDGSVGGSEQATLAALYASARVERARDTALSECVEMVERATALAGASRSAAPVTWGTLTQAEAGGALQYTGHPTDRLRLVLASGFEASYSVSRVRVRGLFAAQQALVYEHDVACGIAYSDGTVDLHVESFDRGGETGAVLRGVRTAEHGVERADVIWVGVASEDGELVRERFEAASGNVDFGAAVLVVDQTSWHQWSRAVVDGVETERRSRWLADSWVHGGSAYRIDGARIETMFADGAPAELDAWAADGKLLTDGLTAGRLQLQRADTSVALVWRIHTAELRVEEHELSDR